MFTTLNTENGVTESETVTPEEQTKITFGPLSLVEKRVHTKFR